MFRKLPFNKINQQNKQNLPLLNRSYLPSLKVKGLLNKDDTYKSSPKVHFTKNKPQLFVNVLSNSIEDEGQDEIDGCFGNLNNPLDKIKEYQSNRNKIVGDNKVSVVNTCPTGFVSKNFQLSGVKQKSFENPRNFNAEIKTTNFPFEGKNEDWPKLVKRNICDVEGSQILNASFRKESKDEKFDVNKDYIKGKDHSELYTINKNDNSGNGKEQEAFVNDTEDGGIKEQDAFVDGKKIMESANIMYKDDEKMTVNIDVNDNDHHIKSKEQTENIKAITTIKETEKEVMDYGTLFDKSEIAIDVNNYVTKDDVAKEDLNPVSAEGNIKDFETVAEEMDYLDIRRSNDVYTVLTDTLMLSDGDDNLVDLENIRDDKEDLLTFSLIQQDVIIQVDQNIDHKEETNELMQADGSGNYQLNVLNDEGIAMDENDEVKSCKSTDSSDTGYASNSNRELSVSPSPEVTSPTILPLVQQKRERSVLVHAKKSYGSYIRSDDKKIQLNNLVGAEEPEFIKLGSFPANAYFVEDTKTKRSSSGRTRRKQLQQISRKKPVISVNKFSEKDKPYKAELNKIQCKAYRLKR